MFLTSICVCLLRDELKPSKLLLLQVRLIDLKYSLIGVYSDSCFMQEVRIWSEFSRSGQPCRQSGSVCISNLLIKAFSLLCPDLRRCRVVLMSLFWWRNQSTMPGLVLEFTLGLPKSFR